MFSTNNLSREGISRGSGQCLITMILWKRTPMKDFDKMMYDFLMDATLDQIKESNNTHVDRKSFAIGKVIFSRYKGGSGTEYIWAELDGFLYNYKKSDEIEARYQQILQYLDEQQNLYVEKKFRDYIELELPAPPKVENLVINGY